MKHTKGPWKVNNVFIENEPNRFIVSQDKWGGINIADCGLSGDGNWDVNEANAILIAAAPEMLEAIELIHGYAGAAMMSNTLGRATKLEQIRVLSAAIIAKAEGR